MDEGRNWTKGLVWPSQDGPQSQTSSPFLEGSRDQEMERAKSARMLAGDLYKFGNSNGASLDFLSSPLYNKSAMESMSQVQGHLSLQEHQNQNRNQLHPTTMYNTNFNPYHGHMFPQMPADSRKMLKDGLKEKPNSLRMENMISDQHTYNNFHKLNNSENFHSVSDMQHKSNQNADKQYRDNAFLKSNQNFYPHPQMLQNNPSLGRTQNKSDKFVQQYQGVHENSVNFDKLADSKKFFPQGERDRYPKGTENTKSFLPSSSPDIFSLTHEDVIKSDFFKGNGNLNNVYPVNGLSKHPEQNKDPQKFPGHVSKQRNDTSERVPSRNDLLPQFGFTPFPDWMKDPKYSKHTENGVYKPTYNGSREVCNKRKIKKDQQDLIGVLPKKKPRKMKTGTGNKVDEGLHSYTQNQNHLTDQYTGASVLTKEVKPAGGNPDPNNQIQSQVQKVLDSIQKEVAARKIEEYQNKHGHNHKEEILNKIGLKNGLEEEKSAEHLAVESLMDPEACDQGRKTPSCCTNCVKLGFRNSPQCTNKRSTGEVDVFDFDAEEEGNKNSLPPFPWSLSKNTPSSSVGDSTGVQPTSPLSFATSSTSNTSTSEVVSVNSSTSNTSEAVSANMKNNCSTTNSLSFSSAYMSTGTNYSAVEVNGPANVRFTEAARNGGVSYVHSNVEGKPLAQINHVELKPQAQINHVEGIPQVQVNHVEGIPQVQVNHVEGIPQVQVNHVELKPQAQINHVEGIPQVQVDNVEGIPQVQVDNEKSPSRSHTWRDTYDVKTDVCYSADKNDLGDNTKAAENKEDVDFKIAKSDLHKQSGAPVNGGLDKLAWVADHVQKIKSTITENDELADRLRKNVKVEFPMCGCRGPNYVPSEDVEGPYYTHLGAGRSIQAVRELLEKRTGVTGKAIRIEKIRYTGKEGKSVHGCPIAKWIIRRSSEEEKYLCLVKPRQGHFCETACLIVVLVAWEGVPSDKADDLYGYLIATLPSNGFETERRCGTNERKTCACQGVDLVRRGASFSFGCSWSMYFNGCKFARSREAKKFKLKDGTKEEELENRLEDLATMMAPLYEQMAPDAYNNQTMLEKQDLKCRLGNSKGRPFSGVTACVDFCAHAHKDLHNMNNGSTVVVTLTKHRGLQKPDDEQLHVLPLHVMDGTDEYGNPNTHLEQIKNGSLEVLHAYAMEARMRASPLTPSRKKKGKKGTGTSPGGKRGRPAKQTGSTPTTPQGKDLEMNSQDSSSVLADMYYKSNSAISDSQTNKNREQQMKGSNNTFNENKIPVPNDGAMEMAFWNYFYTYGTFPPPEFISALQSQTGCKNTPSEQLGKCSSESKNVPIKQEEHFNTASSKMASEQSSVISNHLPSVSSNTQGRNHGAEIQANGFLSNTRQQTCGDTPLDLSSSGSSDKLTAAFQASQGSTDDQNSSCIKSGSKDLISGSKPADDTVLTSPLHLLSEAVSLRSKILGEDMERHHAMNLPQASLEGGNSHSLFHQQMDSQASKTLTSISEQHSSNDVKEELPHRLDNGYKFAVPQQVDRKTMSGDPNSVIDPTVVKCEMEYNERAFHDSEIGGVAIALQHGAVLFEVAKRELHATTGLRNPNRYAPTRISLVFYQHKNLNHSHHGWYEYEKKCETLRQKRLEQMHLESNNISAEMPDLPLGNDEKGKKRKSKKAKIDITKTSAAQYKYMWEAPVGRADSLTTDSVITRWIDPQPMVTGPYQRWV